MIRNIKFKLIDNKEKWVWVDNEAVSDILLRRLFRALKNSVTIEEQINSIKMVTDNTGRSNRAIESLHYSHDNKKVEVFLCNYNETTNTYARGKKIDEFDIN